MVVSTSILNKSSGLAVIDDMVARPYRNLMTWDKYLLYRPFGVSG
jgi:hypothetical protein